MNELSQQEVVQTAEKYTKSNIELLKKFEERDKKQSEQIKTLTDFMVAMKKQNDPDAKKYAKDPLMNDQIEKNLKESNELNDKLKSDALKKQANKKYSTVEGLAQTISTREEFKKAPDGFIKTAQSILNDPHKDEVRKAWQKMIKDPLNAVNKANYQKKLGEIRTNDTKGDKSFIKKALTEIVSEQAGYFAPPEVDLMIQKVLFETSPLRQVATVKTTTRESYSFVTRTSLPTANWGNTEVGTEDSQEQKYRTGKIDIHELHAKPAISLKMLEDSVINIESELRDGIAEAFMLAENKAFIQGTGVGQPYGLITYATKGANTFETGKPLKVEYHDMKLSEYTSDNKKILDSLLDLESKVLSAYKNGAVYLISRPVKNIIRQVKTTTGQYLFSATPGWGAYSGVPSIRDGLNGRINGYGILECDDLPATLNVNARTNFPVFFGNFSKYKICDRIGLTLIKDNVTDKGYIIFFFRKRVGGGFVFTQGVKALRIVA